MELIRFIFSNFWIWLGSLIMLYVILDTILKIVQVIKGYDFSDDDEDDEQDWDKEDDD